MTFLWNQISAMRLHHIMAVLVVLISCRKDDPGPEEKILQLAGVRIGTVYLETGENNPNMPVDRPLEIIFSSALDTASVPGSIYLREENTGIIEYLVSFDEDLRTIILSPLSDLKNQEQYTLEITEDIKGKKGEIFPGIVFRFATAAGQLTIEQITINGTGFSSFNPLLNIDREEVTIEVSFSDPLQPDNYAGYFTLSGNASVITSLSSDSTEVIVTTANILDGWTRYNFTISEELLSATGYSFDGFTGSFFTNVDSSLKFPLMDDEDLLTLVQQQTFRYFYDFAHPVSGMTRERNTSGDLVTTGGSGFGIMALIVGIERGFITREQGMSRFIKILDFLETSDRYHGVWPHWLNGTNGNTLPFSTNDDGGDLVETSFLVQGLLTMRQYLDTVVSSEKVLSDRINALCDDVEYDWYTRGENVLYWHWSPNTEWAMNMKIEGYNEALITYIVAASSGTHQVSADIYHSGYTRNGAITNGNSYYGHELPLGQAFGGPLFFAHYSFLGLDPRNLSDDLAWYWEQNVNHSLINWEYCRTNPNNFPGYSEVSWGLTASDNPWGYNAHAPSNDLGVITPSAAVSSLPYTPVQLMEAIRFFYYILGDKLWGDYGFYDAFNVNMDWWANSYIAIDQGPIICMIENHRTGLLWDLFMSAPEIQAGLTKLGFTF